VLITKLYAGMKRPNFEPLFVSTFCANLNVQRCKNGKTISRSYTTNTGELKKRVRFNPNNLYQTTPKIISRLLTPYKKTIRRRGISSLPKRNKNNKKTRNYNYKK
jgi:hypothetical protein